MKKLFEKFAQKATEWTGSLTAFIIAFSVILVWAVTGPLFNFSETWQLVINTGTTIITFLMVFIIQKSQMVNIEGFTEEELDILHKFYEKLAKKAEQKADIHESHSIDAANELHKSKMDPSTDSGN